MYSTCPATDRGTPNQPESDFPKLKILGHKAQNILYLYMQHGRMVLSLYNAIISWLLTTLVFTLQSVFWFEV